MDIRSFFKSKTPPNKPINKESSTITAPSIPVKRADEIEDLVDSDDDFVENVNRKRIHNKNNKKMSPQKTISKTKENPDKESSTKKSIQKVDLVTDIAQELPIDSCSSARSSDKPTILEPKVTSQITTIVPILNSSVKKSTSSSARKEIVGGANVFFGESPATTTTTTTTTSNSNTERVAHGTMNKEKTITKETFNYMPPNGVPNGFPGCLNGVKIAFTGTMVSSPPVNGDVAVQWDRASVESLVLKYGGKISKAVSSKTSFLVASDVLEDGRPACESMKYREAVERKTPIITVEMLCKKIQSSNPKNEPVKWSGNILADVVDLNASSEDEEGGGPGRGGKASLSMPQRSVSTSSSNLPIRASSSSSLARHVSGTSSSAMTPTVRSKDSSEGDMWVDKYKPHTLDDVAGGTEMIKKLLDWLNKWDDMHIKKTAKVPFSKENPGARAVLLSGPPGIGKTTMATLAAKHLKYEVLELNASDTRNKASIVEQVGDVTSSRALSMTGGLRKRLIIMDEVDGMGGGDRGGIPELIKIIKTTKNPIICICNDRQSIKIRSLANHCYDLRVRRPNKSTVATRLVHIAKMEGLMMEQNAAELLVEQVGNDIRQAIHTAQMWRAKSTTMRYGDLAPASGASQSNPYHSVAAGQAQSKAPAPSSNMMSMIEKDKMLRLSAFDACGHIMGGQKNDLHERYNSFFIDYSLIPLLVQQNYLDAARSGLYRPGTHLSDSDKIDALSCASQAVSDMELLGAGVFGADSHWELLPAQAAMCVRVGSFVQGFQGFPTFPAWLGKNSSTGRKMRLTQEIVTHTALNIGQGFTSIRLEYIPYLRSILLSYLLSNKSDSSEESAAIEHVVDVLDSYGLDRDDFMETFHDMQFLVTGDAALTDRYELINSKVKTALTKLYNSREHRSQALVDEQQIGKKRRVASGGEAEDEDFAGTTEDMDATRAYHSDVDSDEEIAELLKKTKGKPKAKAPESKAKATTSASNKKAKK